MRALAQIFGRSPLIPILTHLARVDDCVSKLRELFEAFFQGNQEKIQLLSDQISELEHIADTTKDDIRNHFRSSLFMPIDGTKLMSILSIQDSIADKAEDLGIILSLRPLTVIPEIKPGLQEFLDKNLEAFKAAKLVIEELERLLQSSFAGAEAAKVKLMVDDVALKEHEVDLIKRRLLKFFFNKCDGMPTAVFTLWLDIINSLGLISDLSEQLAKHIRMTLETK